MSRIAILLTAMLKTIGSTESIAEAVKARLKLVVVNISDGKVNNKAKKALIEENIKQK